MELLGPLAELAFCSDDLYGSRSSPDQFFENADSIVKICK